MEGEARLSVRSPSVLGVGRGIGYVFNTFSPDLVVNLAAQAGVRHSLKDPFSYVNSNLVGFVNIIELCRQFNVEGLIYASSSSVQKLFCRGKRPFSSHCRTKGV